MGSSDVSFPRPPFLLSGFTSFMCAVTRLLPHPSAGVPWHNEGGPPRSEPFSVFHVSLSSPNLLFCYCCCFFFSSFNFSWCISMRVWGFCTDASPVIFYHTFLWISTLLPTFSSTVERLEQRMTAFVSPLAFFPVRSPEKHVSAPHNLPSELKAVQLEGHPHVLGRHTFPGCFFSAVLWSFSFWPWRTSTIALVL